MRGPDGSEEKPANVLESGSDAIFTIDGGWRFTYLNSEAERVLARDGERLLGKDCRETPPETIGALLYQEFSRALGERSTVESRHYHPALDTWFEVRAYPLESGLMVSLREMNGHGHRDGLPGIARHALDASSSGALITDATLPDNPIIYANRALQDITGYPEEEMLGHNCRFLQGEDRGQPALGGLRQAIRDGSDWKGVLRNYRRDGTLFYNELYVAPLRDDEGCITHYIGVHNDVTARMEAGREPLEDEGRDETVGAADTVEDITRRGQDARLLLASIVEHSEEAIIANTLGGTVTSWNPAAERLFGYTAREMIGESVDVLNPAENPAENLEEIRIVGRTGASKSQETVRVAKDGSRIEVSVMRSPIRDEEGNVTGTSAIFRDISERNAAEHALMESEARFRNLVELSPDAIAVHSEGTLLYINPAGARLLGAERAEQILGCPVMNIVHPDYREAARERVRRVQSDGVQAEPLEEEFLRLDGEIAHVEVSGRPITYEGRPAVQFLARDITERKRAEESLRQSEERYRRMVELSPEPIIVHIGGELVYANPAAARIVGAGSAGELIGRRIMEFVHPDFRELAEELLSSSSTRKGTEGLDYQRLIRPDGETVDIELISLSIVYEERRAVQVMFRNITWRLRAEKALRQSEERYRAIVEDQTEMICRFSPDKTLTFVNEAYCQHFGVAQEDLIGSSFMPLVPEEERHALDERLFSLDSGRPTSTIEHRVVDGEGGIRWHQWTDRALFDEQGELTGYQSVGRDITARKEAEQALQRERNLLRTVMDSTRDFIFSKDTEHRFRLSNAAHQSILGVGSEEEILDKTNADYWGKETTAPFHADDRRVLDSGESIVDREEKVHGASGEEMWISTTKVPLRAADGTVEGLVAVSRDITERRREQHELATAAARLTSLIRNMPSGILVEDEERNIRYANAAITEMFEMAATPEELASDDCDIAVRDVMKLLADPEGFVQRIEEILAEARPVTGEEVLLEDGRVYERDYVPVYVQGEYRGHMWHYRDLTGRKRVEEDLRHSEARLRALFEQTAVGVCVTDLDRRIIQTNAAYQRITGYGAEELVGMRTPEITHPDDRAGDANVAELFLEKRKESYLREKRFIRKDGGVIWAKANSSLVRDERGEPRFAIGVVEDVTERREAQEGLADSERLLRAVTRGAPVILFATDREGVLTLAEGKALELFGLESGETVGQPVFEVYADLPQVVRNVRRALAGEEVAATVDIGGIAFEARYSPMRNGRGEVTGSVGVATDITARRELERELEHRAFHDPLTGLPNRSLFMDRLEHALARTARREQRVAVLFLDLDGFKHVNDSIGHSAGDTLLIEAGRRIESCLREDDTVARLGGDEFAVLLEEVPDSEFASRVAQRIASEMRHPVHLKGIAEGSGWDQEVIVTMSLGIALSDPDDTSVEAEELLQRADSALYTVKDNGKDHHQLFRQEMKDRSSDLLRLGRDLRLAIERDELVLHYQPKINLLAGGVPGLEALVRWEHPKRGLVFPSEFVPLAEENGLIAPLGRQVLMQACRHAKEWQLRHGDPGAPDLSICVNVSARQLSSPELLQHVEAALSETGLDPSTLVLEITESVIIQQDHHSVSVLRELKKLGVQLAIDDFGSGYSSLSYLKNLPVDILKIDRSLVSDIGHDPASAAIVSAAVAVAHALGLKAVAEGVEDEAALGELRRLGCDFGQGYYWSRPLPAEEIPYLL